MKKVAVIGYGNKGALLCSQIIKNSKTELKGIYDINSLRSAKAKGSNIFVYNSNEDIFNDNSIDIIAIAAPYAIHEELVIKALKSGHNVICENPIAVSAEEFDRMITIKEKSKKCLTAHASWRFDDNFTAIKSLAKRNNLGDILRIESRLQGYEYTVKKSTKNDILLNSGFPLIDQILELIQERVTSVYCQTDEVKENGSGFRLEISFESGKTAYIEVGTHNFLPLPRFYLEYENGTAYIEEKSKTIKIAQPDKSEKKESKGQNSIKIYNSDFPANFNTENEFYNNFCDVIDSKAEQLIKNSQMRRVICIIKNARYSAKLNKRIETFL